MKPIIECRSLGKSYGSNRALDGVGFSLDAGDVAALVGPNGAGKTTLLSILCGYLRPDEGSLQLFGAAPGAAILNGRIGALPQDAQLDPRFAIAHQLTLYARLQGMSAAAARQEARRVLARVQLDEVLDEKPAALSHGMRKRVSIAQALIGDPELILLDEPTAGLDPANARNVRQLVTELGEQTTVIISSHNLDELERLCNKVLLLQHGHMSEQPVGAIDDSYLTLVLEPQAASDPLGVLAALEGVIEVTSPQKNEYLIRYDDRQGGDMDLRLMQCLAQQGWGYRQLVKGRTLETQLFADQ